MDSPRQRRDVLECERKRTELPPQTARRVASARSKGCSDDSAREDEGSTSGVMFANVSVPSEEVDGRTAGGEECPCVTCDGVLALGAEEGWALWDAKPGRAALPLRRLRAQSFSHTVEHLRARALLQDRKEHILGGSSNQ
jgi:hypothetical protein